jgi:hypothetical protein
VTASSTQAVIRDGQACMHSAAGPGLVCYQGEMQNLIMSLYLLSSAAAPEGLEGWRPEDFRRGPPGRGGPGQGPNIHPDIGPPPPGRGTDWDSMFG